MFARFSTMFRLSPVPFLILMALAIFAASGVARADKLKVEVVSQVGHSSAIHSLAISPDGRLAVSGSRDKTLKIWDTTTGLLLRTLEGHADEINSVALSPDGRSALSASRDKTLKLWDLETGKLVRTFVGHRVFVHSVAFSPDGKLALSASGATMFGGGEGDNTVRLWDVATGSPLRTFTGHSDGVSSVAFSPDGRHALSGSWDKTVKLWDVRTGKLQHTFVGHSDQVNAVAFSPDGRSAISISRDNAPRLWDVPGGTLIRTFEGGSATLSSLAFSPDGRTALAGGSGWSSIWDVATGKKVKTFRTWPDDVRAVAFAHGGRTAVLGCKNKLELWDISSGEYSSTFIGVSEEVNAVRYSPNRPLAVSAGSDGTVKVWETSSGKLVRVWDSNQEAAKPRDLDALLRQEKILFYTPEARAAAADATASGIAAPKQTRDRPIKFAVQSLAISPDGLSVLSGGYKYLRLWDIATGRLIRDFGKAGDVNAIGFSPDGRTVLTGSNKIGAPDDKPLRLWDVATGRILRVFDETSDDVYAIAFSIDGRSALSRMQSGAIKQWDISTGKLLRTINNDVTYSSSLAVSPDGRSLVAQATWGGELALWDVSTGKMLRTLKGHSETVKAVAFSPDGRTILSGSEDKTLKLWDVATGNLLRTFQGHANTVNSVAFSPDGRSVISGGKEGVVRFWSLASGKEAVEVAANSSGDWLAITPAGFFDRGGTDGVSLNIVQGLAATALEQTYRSLYDPDLVREALAGDPDGEVKRASEVINLDKVIDSGPAPTVQIVTPETKSAVTGDVVTAVAKVTDRGKGIGRIEWRVNGVTAAITSVPAGGGPEFTLTQELALDGGVNAVELVAYNSSNLLASLPARATVAASPTDSQKPKLHVLAVGINAYIDKGSKAADGKGRQAFPPLNLAVKDATALAAALKLAGARQYAEVKVAEALDADASAAGLQATIERMATEVHPRDTFVLFAAAHGVSQRGRFYLIPQDYDGGIDLAALESRAIGQDRLQDWVANKIKAKKVLILLDTCESGALVGGATRARTDVPTSQAALGRLHEATGRPVLTAAAEGKPAFEGFEGHGVFTWALLDALKNGDRNANGKIELTELVAHVQDQVPRIAAKLDGRGRAAVLSRGSANDRQSARFGSRGEDFALVGKLD